MAYMHDCAECYLADSCIMEESLQLAFVVLLCCILREIFVVVVVVLSFILYKL